MAADPPKELMVAERIIQHPYKCKITETRLKICLWNQDHWPVHLNNSEKSDVGATVVWEPKAKAQRIFEVLRPHVEKNMDEIMSADDSWYVPNRPWCLIFHN